MEERGAVFGASADWMIRRMSECINLCLCVPQVLTVSDASHFHHICTVATWEITATETKSGTNTAHSPSALMLPTASSVSKRETLPTSLVENAAGSTLSTASLHMVVQITC
jgi:hypothetical protein